MWYLEVFDRKSGELVRDYPLPGMDKATIKELLEVDESLYPVGAGAHPIALNELTKFTDFVDETVPASSDFNYYASLFSD